MLKEQAEKGEIHLLFYDPTHQVHNTINGRCWQPKGKDGTIILPSNTGRRRISILGAIDVVSGGFFSLITEDNCDTEMTKTTLYELRNDKAYRNKKKIVLIMDNASYNRSYKTQHFANRLGIELKYLPPYSPNLNLIERLWKYMKKKILKNTYYKTFIEFYQAILDFCKNVQNYNQDIRKLINHKFNIIKEA